MDLTNTVLGIELGSTRIKAMLLDEKHEPVASGSFEWENRFVDGVFTYSMQDIHDGIRACYADLKRDVREKYHVNLICVGAIGISGMMHGYLPFDKDWQPLAAFRTWRNIMTAEASEALTALFGFHIPQRWSIAHLYHAMRNGEEHLPRLAHITTLAGYIHKRLTGENCVGVGEGSGIFPIDSATKRYDAMMLQKFDALLAEHGFSKKTVDLLPKVLPAGETAGYLTPEGARFLDPSGDLLPGIPFAPCEGDALTSIVATNSVRPRRSSLSAGTSIVLLAVLDRAISAAHEEIDVLMTPSGHPVALTSSDNCTSDINAWVRLFSEVLGLFGAETDVSTLYQKLFQKAMEGEANGGGLFNCNYISGEHILHLSKGRPLFVRTPDSRFDLANFMRVQLYSALVTLKIGLDAMKNEEHISIERIYAQGGFFKTPHVGDRLLSAATGLPVSVMQTAGEGGPYGMALLTTYMLWKTKRETLEDYLDHKVFRHVTCTDVQATSEEIEGFAAYFERYRNLLSLERAASETI